MSIIAQSNGNSKPKHIDIDGDAIHDELVKDGWDTYYIKIPNIIDDLDLSLAAFRLYVHMLRVAGGKRGGKCWQGVRTLKKECGMSITTVIKAKKELMNPRPELGGKPLITWLDQNPSDRFEISDIWVINDKHAKDKKPRRRAVHISKKSLPPEAEKAIQKMDHPDPENGSPRSRKWITSDPENGSPAIQKMDRKNKQRRINMEELTEKNAHLKKAPIGAEKEKSFFFDQKHRDHALGDHVAKQGEHVSGDHVARSVAFDVSDRDSVNSGAATIDEWVRLFGSQWSNVPLPQETMVSVNFPKSKYCGLVGKVRFRDQDSRGRYSYLVKFKTEDLPDACFLFENDSCVYDDDGLRSISGCFLSKDLAAIGSGINDYLIG